MWVPRAQMAQDKLQYPSHYPCTGSPPLIHLNLWQETRGLRSAHTPRNHDTTRHGAHGSDLRQRGTHLTDLTGEHAQVVEGPPRADEASAPLRPQWLEEERPQSAAAEEAMEALRIALYGGAN